MDRAHLQAQRAVAEGISETRVSVSTDATIPAPPTEHVVVVSSAAVAVTAHVVQLEASLPASFASRTVEGAVMSAPSTDSSPRSTRASVLVLAVVATVVSAAVAVFVLPLLAQSRDVLIGAIAAFVVVALTIARSDRSSRLNLFR